MTTYLLASSFGRRGQTFSVCLFFRGLAITKTPLFWDRIALLKTPMVFAVFRRYSLQDLWAHRNSLDTARHTYLEGMQYYSIWNVEAWMSLAWAIYCPLFLEDLICSVEPSQSLSVLGRLLQGCLLVLQIHTATWTTNCVFEWTEGFNGSAVIGIVCNCKFSLRCRANDDCCHTAW